MIELHENSEFEQVYARFKNRVARYICGKTLKSIAETMDISYSYVKLLHADALKALREIINERK